MHPKLVFLLVLGALLATSCQAGKVLVFGGNGLLGADTVEQFLQQRYDVFTVSRGSWYWDSKERISDKVRSHTQCDRQKPLSSCSALVNLLHQEEKFDAVVDFSAYQVHQVSEAASLLANRTDLYILISTDSVYDLSPVKSRGETCKEEDSINVDQLQSYTDHRYATNKLHAEKEMIEQRQRSDGIPYVILRLPDVIGPRDSTHRWWMYQLWIKLSSEIAEKSVLVPEFLDNTAISLVYSPDVAKLIFSLLSNSRAKDNIYNVAWSDTFTLREILKEIKDMLRLGPDVKIGKLSADNPRQFFLYPSGRNGPMDVSKAYEQLRWEPTPPSKAFWNTVQFYERAMKDARFQTQLDEVIQMLGNEIMLNDNKTVMYLAIEKLYGISLKHFTGIHEEL